MSNQPELEGKVTRIRRRPTRRHRRNRLIRLALFVTVCALLTACFSSVALRYLAPSLLRASRNNEELDRQVSEASLNRFLAAQEAALEEMEKRPIYRYSIVPGGVRTVQELKQAAEHDPVVAVHYAGFDYDHARVVKLALAQTAYVSYRIGSRVYWTRHRVTLKKGETVITDGKMTARARCANRVEEAPQQQTSKAEPPAAAFEEPVSPPIGTAIANPPGPFQSALAKPRAVASLGPMLPLSMYDPLRGGLGSTPMIPPPLPSVCGIGGKKPANSTATASGKKKKVDLCGNVSGGAEVPEPGTWLLVGSGLAFLAWKTRDRFART